MKRNTILITCCLLFCGLVSCASDKLTHERFSMIRERVSTRTDVEMALGEPTGNLGSQWLYARPSKHLTVLIDYDESGKVARKQWIDAMAPVWEDSTEK